MTTIGPARKQKKAKAKPAVTFWRNHNPGEFGDKWRVDFGEGIYDWCDTFSDLASWLYEKDYPRRLFTNDKNPDFVRACDLELALFGELDAARQIRKWHDRHYNKSRRR
jgi:hypothetical protein